MPALYQRRAAREQLKESIACGVAHVHVVQREVVENRTGTFHLVGGVGKSDPSPVLLLVNAQRCLPITIDFANQDDLWRLKSVAPLDL